MKITLGDTRFILKFGETWLLAVGCLLAGLAVGVLV